MELNKVTRFEVIDESGRLLVRYDIQLEAQVQDEGRTLKVFLKDNKPKEKESINTQS